MKINKKNNYVFMNIIILDSAVRNDKAMQDFESESLSIAGDHSQTVKAPPIKSGYGSKDCVDLSFPTAESRIMQNLFTKNGFFIPNADGKWELQKETPLSERTKKTLEEVSKIIDNNNISHKDLEEHKERLIQLKAKVITHVTTKTFWGAIFSTFAKKRVLACHESGPTLSKYFLIIYKLAKQLQYVTSSATSTTSVQNLAR
jgi:hypothetical protein